MRLGPTARRWPFVLLLVSVAGMLYRFSRSMMAGMFAGSNPEQLAHWRRDWTRGGAHPWAAAS